jgi:hypothetical protein
MNIKYNSFSAKVYRMFYGVTKMPDSFCTYYRNLLLAYLFFIPVTIIYLPQLIVDLFSKDTYKTSFIGDSLKEKIGMGIIFYFSLTVVIGFLFGVYLLLFHDMYTEEENPLYFNIQVVTGIFLIFGSVGLLVYLVQTLYKKLSNIKFNKTTSNTSTPVSRFTTYIKSIKDKFCPKIEWD